MIQFVDPQTEADLTRDERESFDRLFADNDDPSQRHRIPIRAWHENELKPAFFYEPFDSVTTALLSELTPLFFRSQIVPYCQCDIQYHRLTLAKHHVEAAVSSLQVTTQFLVTLQDLVKQRQFPRTVWQRLKELRGQTFFSQHDLADALVDLLSPILTEDQIQEHGDRILAQIRTVGSNEEIRQHRLDELNEALAPFHHHAPIKPYPPTDQLCPFCHSPYRYSFLELLVSHPKILDRVKNLIIGEIDIPLRDLERILLALEVWLFHHHDADLFTKKKTMVGTMLQMLHQGYQTIMANLTDFDRSANMDASDDSASSSGASIPSPPPIPTPDANSISTSSSGSNEN